MGRTGRHNGGVAREESLTTRLTVETYQPDETQPQPPRRAMMPWWLAALGGALVCLIAGWAVSTALVLIAQLAQTGTVTGPAFKLSTQLWLLAHGGVFELSGTRITLVPLGFTVLVALALHGAAGYAGKQAALAGGDDYRPARAVGLVTVIMAATYAVVTAVVAMTVDPGGPGLRAALGGAVLSLVICFFGARKPAGWDFYRAWPVWLRAVPRAIMAGVLIAVLGGTVAFIAGLVTHRSQFITLTDQLQPGWGGGIVLALLQLFYVVNIIMWCMSWTFGPGFTLGDGSVVSLVGTQVGMLPAFPVTAALPVGEASLWNVVWLVFPVVAGVGAAIVILWGRPRARFDETALVGGLSGVLAGIVVAGLAAVTGGSLGGTRLAQIGPFAVPLLVIAACVMGLAGMITGLVAGLARRPAGSSDPRWWSRWGTPGVPADQPSDDSTAPAKKWFGKSREVAPADEPAEATPGSDGPAESSVTVVLASDDVPDQPTAVAPVGEPAEPAKPVPAASSPVAAPVDEPAPTTLSGVRRWFAKRPKVPATAAATAAATPVPGDETTELVSMTPAGPVAVPGDKNEETQTVEATQPMAEADRPVPRTDDEHPPINFFGDD